MCDCWDAVDGWVWGAVGRVGLGVGMDQGATVGLFGLKLRIVLPFGAFPPLCVDRSDDISVLGVLAMSFVP